ncbi:hypothetical protein EVAR_42959_1 [Eumeta japonica]|uniref:PiggyBac transposable element-derived protein 4 C-terminal zinc-ribbon domain-containing protein n=1 Tax=Eumeta variegata TaxID=151549 RepID=A0A4C1YH75_EUMVA|nr:hypothetical protein EVAR_42959_1 [Eumeta japonica]
MNVRDGSIERPLLLSIMLGPLSIHIAARETKTKREHGEKWPPLRIRASESPKIRHWPKCIPHTLGPGKKYKYWRCKMCALKRKRTETKYRCYDCRKCPALCLVCFEEWHERFSFEE